MHPTPPDALSRCAAVATAEACSLLLDFDGTLVPFADTPADAKLDDEGATLLDELCDAGFRVVIVSGRRRADLDDMRGRVPRAWWVAEHGAWRCDDAGWAHVGKEHPELDELGQWLMTTTSSCVGARVERKSVGVCLHWRRVPEVDRAELIDVAEHVIEEWLERHPAHERLGGVDMLEVRARDQHKGTVVRWVRERYPLGRILAIGDDMTDEDMFAALGPQDVAVVVGAPGDRTSVAQLSVDGVPGVRQFLRWLLELRRGREASGMFPARVRASTDGAGERTGLLAISNRTASGAGEGRSRQVGGLVAALAPALDAEDGVWLGWSGREREGTCALRVDRAASPVRACFDFTTRQRRLYYSGFCNRALWPMLHGLPGRVRYEDAEWREYVAMNEVFARLANDLVRSDGTVWVHDYHLLLVARELRRRGHTGPIGLFLHVPFPSPDCFETLPWSRELLDAMLAFDLVGFHTDAWARRFAETVAELGVAAPDRGARLVHPAGATHVGSFPIGIDAELFQPMAGEHPTPEVEGLRTMLGDRKLLLGVDRLDYSKGIPERLEAFERMLARFPDWRGRVSFVQVSVPSRAEVPEYAELRARVEHLVGRINGHFGEADWVPVRYLYRSYGHDVLAQLYRMADVAVVTPLRDGMNLVAKEFVAAQDAHRPGVLVLSRFAGAAAELSSAILSNPFHLDGLAADLDHALSMPIEERRERHQRLTAAVAETTPSGWARGFLAALARCR